MDFEQIEDRIMEALKKEIPYLRTVETYAGQLESELEKLPVRFPAAFVVYGGSDWGLVDGPSLEERVEFSVLVAARNLRGSRAARRDAHGAYDLIKDALTALVNQDFGLEMERLRPTRTSLVFVNSVMVVYGMDFQTGFDTRYGY